MSCYNALKCITLVCSVLETFLFFFLDEAFFSSLCSLHEIIHPSHLPHATPLSQCYHTGCKLSQFIIKIDISKEMAAWEWQEKNKARKRAKIRNRHNQAPQLTKDTTGKVTTSQLEITNESQEVSPFPAGGHKASTNRRT